MATINQPSVSTGTAETDHSYTDWAAIFAGAVFAAAFSLIMITFGAGLGLSFASPEPGEGVSMRWLMIAAGLWFIWVAVSSFAAGGYIAGRLRRRVGDSTEDEVETRDGAHGVIVWAAGTLIAVVMAASGVGGLLGAAASATGAAAGSVASIIEEQGDYFSSLVVRSGGDERVSPEAREEVTAILARSVSQGEVSDADREYLIQLVASETGADPAEVESGVNSALEQVEAARQEATDMIEQARIAGIVAAFILAATMIVSAAVAYFSATYGGQHRDQNVPFRRFAAGRKP
jgi:heme/copper-type cytochrome/quinol oxidase subunit 2